MRSKQRADISIAAHHASGTDRRIEPSVRRKSHMGEAGAEFTPDQIEFMRAMDDYKRIQRRPFPAWSEVLDVLVRLGYAKCEEPILEGEIV